MVHVAWGLPLVTILFRNFFASVPDSVFNAARLDGAGAWQTFIYIALPLAGPVLAVAAALQFTYIWNDFLLGVTFGSEDVKPITVALSALSGGQLSAENHNVNMAATIIGTFPTIVLYGLFGRTFINMSKY
jgi:glucose/mannose transport system permease protein